MKKTYENANMNTPQANTGHKQVNKVVTSEDYEVGEKSEKVQESIFFTRERKE